MKHDDGKSKILYPPLLTEQNWPGFRHLKANVAALGVRPRRLGRKDVLLTHEVLTALEAQSSGEELPAKLESASSEAPPLPSFVSGDPAAAVRASLGLKLKKAGGE